MDDRERGIRELWGIRLFLVALALGLVWSLMYFPVWSESGSGMLILLGYITAQPLQFVLERVGPAAWVVGGLGAYLIESSRVNQRDTPGRSWNRERFVLVFAVGTEAVLLAVLNSTVLSSPAVSFLVYAATGSIVPIALGLYLLWTSERIAGISMQRLGSVAFAVALVAAALELLGLASIFGQIDLSSSVRPPLSVTGSLLGTGSLAVWLLTYSLTLRKSRTIPLTAPSVAEV